MYVAAVANKKKMSDRQSGAVFRIFPTLLMLFRIFGVAQLYTTALPHVRTTVWIPVSRMDEEGVSFTYH